MRTLFVTFLDNLLLSLLTPYSTATAAHQSTSIYVPVYTIQIQGQQPSLHPPSLVSRSLLFCSSSISSYLFSPPTHTRHTRSPSLKPTTHVRPCSFQRQRSTDRPTRRLSLLKSASQPCINLPDDTDYTLVWYLAVHYLNHPRTSTSLVQVLGLFVVVSPVPVQFYHRPPFPFQTSACLPPLSLPLPPLPPPLSLSPSINPLSFCPPFCASFLLDRIILRSS